MGGTFPVADAVLYCFPAGKDHKEDCPEAAVPELQARHPTFSQGTQADPTLICWLHQLGLLGLAALERYFYDDTLRNGASTHVLGSQHGFEGIFTGPVYVGDSDQVPLLLCRGASTSKLVETRRVRVPSFSRCLLSGLQFTN